MLGESIGVPMLSPNRPHTGKAARVVGGIIFCVCSPLIGGLFGAVVFSGIADLFQWIGYLFSGRFRRTPDASVIINKFDELEGDERKRYFHEWEGETSSDQGGIQLPPD